jgi:hypothetical protein
MLTAVAEHNYTSWRDVFPCFPPTVGKKISRIAHCNITITTSDTWFEAHDTHHTNAVIYTDKLVTGQDGVNVVVDVNSDHNRSLPRFHIGSTGTLPRRGIGDERFLGGGSRSNNNRISLRSALTGRFISSKRLTLHSPGTALRSVATGRFIYGGSANDRKSTELCV